MSINQSIDLNSYIAFPEYFLVFDGKQYKKILLTHNDKKLSGYIEHKTKEKFSNFYFENIGNENEKQFGENIRFPNKNINKINIIDLDDFYNPKEIIIHGHSFDTKIEHYKIKIANGEKYYYKLYNSWETIQSNNWLEIDINTIIKLNENQSILIINENHKRNIIICKYFDTIFGVNIFSNSISSLELINKIKKIYQINTIIKYEIVEINRVDKSISYYEFKDIDYDEKIMIDLPFIYFGVIQPPTFFIPSSSIQTNFADFDNEFRTHNVNINGPLKQVNKSDDYNFFSIRVDNSYQFNIANIIEQKDLDKKIIDILNDNDLLFIVQNDYIIDQNGYIKPNYISKTNQTPTSSIQLITNKRKIKVYKFNLGDKNEILELNVDDLLLYIEHLYFWNTITKTIQQRKSYCIINESFLDLDELNEISKTLFSNTKINTIVIINGYLNPIYKSINIIYNFNNTYSMELSQEIIPEDIVKDIIKSNSFYETIKDYDFRASQSVIYLFNRNAELPIKIWDNLNSKYIVNNIFTKTTLAGILKDNGKLILSRGDLKTAELKNNENIYSNINLITGGIILNENDDYENKFGMPLFKENNNIIYDKRFPKNIDNQNVDIEFLSIISQNQNKINLIEDNKLEAFSLIEKLKIFNGYPILLKDISLDKYNFNNVFTIANINDNYKSISDLDLNDLQSKLNIIQFFSNPSICLIILIDRNKFIDWIFLKQGKIISYDILSNILFIPKEKQISPDNFDQNNLFVNGPYIILNLIPLTSLPIEKEEFEFLPLPEKVEKTEKTEEAKGAEETKETKELIKKVDELQAIYIIEFV
jgi:hypothetical protein